MKKILTVSFYADFSRFFQLSLKGVKHDVDWLNLCIYPSAFLYSIIHGIQAKFLPYVVSKKNKKKSGFSINTSELDALLAYHDNTEKIKSRALKYLYYYSHLLDDFEPDLIILSGDSRLASTCLSYIAKKKAIKVIYFEQGPLNTTILDEEGVNANCSFRKTSSISEDSSSFDQAKRTKPEKWMGYKKYRLFDILSDMILCLIYTENSKYKLPNASRNISDLRGKTKGKYILLILQVPEDANMILHSPYFKDHYSIVKLVYESLPDGFELVVREHPLYVGMYEERLYEYARMHSINVDSSNDLNSSINQSELVIVNNSTVGLESLYLGKGLVVLGDSYYDNEEFVYKYDGGDFAEILNLAIKKPKDKLLVKKRINFLFKQHFILGHFRDLEPSRFSKIGDRINDFLE